MPLLLATVTCWCCYTLASSRVALPGGEVETRVYMRLLGRQRQVLVLALTLTVVALLVGVLAQPLPENTYLHAVRDTRGGCQGGITANPICYRKGPDGAWQWMELGGDGAWALSPPPDGLTVDYHFEQHMHG